MRNRVDEYLRGLQEAAAVAEADRGSGGGGSGGGDCCGSGVDESASSCFCCGFV
jgi:hypothetical protein